MAIPVLTIRIPAALRTWVNNTIGQAGVGLLGRPLTRADVILAALQLARTHGNNHALTHLCMDADHIRRLAADAATP